MSFFVLSLSHAALRELVRPDRVGRLAFGPVGFCRRPERIDFFAHTIRRSPADSGNQTRHLLVRLPRSPAEFHDPFLPPHDDRLVGELRLGIAAAAGQLQAVRYSGQRAIPFDEVRIIGPAMPSFGQAGPPTSAEEREQWSRTIGAMGDQAWQRLHQLHVAIIGCGRSGSLAASALAQTGVGTLTLIDADPVEPHNLGEMTLVSRADLGKPKSQALADALGRRQAVRLHVCPAPISELPALLQASTADVLIGCVDNAAARLAATITAALYLKPLLDIGTGIFREDAAVWGAEVRLVLPGQCLLCLGGIADLNRGLAELFDGPAPRPVDWRTQRAGSLHSLNGMAVFLGLRLLEELLIGRRQQSLWMHLDGTATGGVRLEERPGRSNCVLCDRTGQGDEGLTNIRSLLSTAV
jgi:molybdopterin/thiamine biosynthesis adenylyltransferase